MDTRLFSDSDSHVMTAFEPHAFSDSVMNIEEVPETEDCVEKSNTIDPHCFKSQGVLDFLKDNCELLHNLESFEILINNENSFNKFEIWMTFTGCGTYKLVSSDGLTFHECNAVSDRKSEKSYDIINQYMPGFQIPDTPQGFAKSFFDCYQGGRAAFYDFMILICNYLQSFQIRKYAIVGDISIRDAINSRGMIVCFE